MFEKLLEHREHVPPHRIWAFLHGETLLQMAEHMHILGCPHCQNVVRVCVQSESFGAALKSLGYDEQKSA